MRFLRNSKLLVNLINISVGSHANCNKEQSQQLDNWNRKTSNHKDTTCSSKKILSYKHLVRRWTAYFWGINKAFLYSYEDLEQTVYPHGRLTRIRQKGRWRTIPQLVYKKQGCIDNDVREKTSKMHTLTIHTHSLWLCFSRRAGGSQWLIKSRKIQKDRPAYPWSVFFVPMWNDLSINSCCYGTIF